MTEIPDLNATDASNTTVAGFNITDNLNIDDIDNVLRATYGMLARHTRRGADVASAATLDLDAAKYEIIDITGTTTTTAITLTDTHWRVLRAVGTWPLTASSSLIINGSTSISYTCAVNDLLLVEGYGSGVVRVWVISTQTSKATLATKATASGTAVNFTGIPPGVSKIAVMFSQMSLSGTDVPLLQIGDSGGIEATGYAGSTSAMGSGGNIVVNATAGFALYGNPSAAANVLNGVVFLSRMDGSNTWAANISLGRSDAAVGVTGGGVKQLTAELDRVRITTGPGTDTFDAGEINISWWY